MSLCSVIAVIEKNQRTFGVCLVSIIVGTSETKENPGI
jgi:hypothetical protein